MIKSTNTIQFSKSQALQIFQVLRQGCIILISILLAKSGISTHEIGNYELLLFIASSLTFFWVSGLIQGMLSVFPTLKEADQKGFVFQIYLLFTGLSILVFLLLYLGQNSLVPLLTGQQELAYFHWYIIFLLVNIPTYLVEYLYLLKDKARAIILWGMFIFIGQIIAFVGPIYLGYDLKYGFWGLIVLGIVKHLWASIQIGFYGKFDLQFKYFKEFLKVSAPLMAYALVAGFALLFDNWLVGWYYQSEEAFAVFKYGARELPLATALAAALSAAMIPELVNPSEEGLELLKQKATRLMHYLFPISIILLLFSDYLYPLVFSDAFVESAAVFDVYLLILISRLLFPHSILIAIKKTTLLWYTSLVELLINIVLSCLLVKFWGMPGIALATVIAFLFEKLWYVYYLSRHKQIPFSSYTSTVVFGSYSLLLIGVFLGKVILFN